MEEADSPQPSFLKRLRLRFSRRIITQPEDLEREIQHIIDEGEERGLITRQEGQLIESIFEFRDTLVREIMVPRLEMVGVERTPPLTRLSPWSCPAATPACRSSTATSTTSRASS